MSVPTNSCCCLLCITSDKFNLHTRLQESLNTFSDKWTRWITDSNQAHIYQVLERRSFCHANNWKKIKVNYHISRALYVSHSNMTYLNWIRVRTKLYIMKSSWAIIYVNVEWISSVLETVSIAIIRDWCSSIDWQLLITSDADSNMNSRINIVMPKLSLKIVN